MPHLRVAHLAIGQANGPTTGFNQGVGIGMPQGIHHRGGRGTDGVVGFVMAIAPTIKNGENSGSNWGGLSKRWVSQH